MTESTKAEPTAPQVHPPRSRKNLILCGVAALLLIALDLGSKEWALDALSQERTSERPPICEPDDEGRMYMQRLRTDPVVLIPGYLELRYAENCGAAFGLMHRAPAALRRSVFGIAALLASFILLRMYRQGRGGRLFAWSVPLIVSGAVGNLTDRFRHGFVVDFVRFHLQDGWEWPTFNIADSTITVGVVLLLIDQMREPRGKPETKKTE